MSDHAHDESPAESLDFPINQRLLEEAIHAREEWRVIRDRLLKIEQNKDQVSPAVYERVHKDYEKRLADVFGVLLEKKGEIDRELGTLRSTLGRIQSQLETHRHTLEEIKFRNLLGEFNETEYQEKSKTSQEKLGKFEAIVTAINSNISRYEAIFQEEKDLIESLQGRQGSGSLEEVSEATPLKKLGAKVQSEGEEPLTDDSGFILEDEGKNYFSDSGGTDVGIESSTTVKTRAPLQKDERQPRVVLISGENAGMTFPVKETISIGRAEANTIVLRDNKVSRQHAKIQRKGKEFILTDLNSSNGCYVNGQRVEEHVLANDDEIRIGDSTLQFQE